MDLTCSKLGFPSFCHQRYFGTFQVLVKELFQVFVTNVSRLGFPSLGHRINKCKTWFSKFLSSKILQDLAFQVLASQRNNMFKAWFSKRWSSILQDLAFQVLVIEITCSRLGFPNFGCKLLYASKLGSQVLANKGYGP